MAAGRNSFLIAVLAVVAGFWTSPAWSKDVRIAGILKLLRAADFSFSEKKDAYRLVPLGPILVAGKHYEIWDFAWEDRRRLNPDKTPLERSSLIVLEQTASGLFYTGSYEVGSTFYHVCVIWFLVGV